MILLFEQTELLRGRGIQNWQVDWIPCPTDAVAAIKGREPGGPGQQALKDSGAQEKAGHWFREEP